ncbi:Y-family DNA polymerase [Streptococcus suis]
MNMIDYSREPKSDIAFIDMKSFYASVECVSRGLHPLKTSLCVMSRADNSGGLILASSPIFKEVFGKSNVGRAYDLPFDINTRKFSYYNAKRQGLPTDPAYVKFIEEWAVATVIVPPRMDLYIEKNIDIQHIFQQYGSIEDIMPYSIDEGFIDLTSSLKYFIPNQMISRKDKLDMLSAKIQRDIYRKTGVYSTIGMSNANPLLAKLALDNEAKKTHNMRANWSYEDVTTKVWGISKLTDFWGIGTAIRKRLEKLGIYTIKELAEYNPDLLKKEFGVYGVQLWFHANGVDESNVHIPYKPKSKGLGNSQVLPRDYFKQYEIELVLKEMAEQVAIRLRGIHKKTTTVYIGIGYSWFEEKTSFRGQMKIEPTNLTEDLQKYVISLFRKKYNGGAVRSIAVSYSSFVDENLTILNLFDDPEELLKKERLQTAIDSIRNQFGFTMLQKANVLTSASRSIARSKLIGGHSAGGLDGLK